MSVNLGVLEEATKEAAEAEFPATVQVEGFGIAIECSHVIPRRGSLGNLTGADEVSLRTELTWEELEVRPRVVIAARVEELNRQMKRHVS